MAKFGDRLDLVEVSTVAESPRASATISRLVDMKELQDEVKS